MSPFCGATDTPVSDFCRYLLWVSKPECFLPYLRLLEAYVLHYMFPEIHLWCDTCWPLGSQHGNQAVSSTYLRGIDGTQNRELSCHCSQCEIRQMLYRLSYPSSAALSKLNKFSSIYLPNNLKGNSFQVWKTSIVIRQISSIFNFNWRTWKRRSKYTNKCRILVLEPCIRHEFV